MPSKFSRWCRQPTTILGLAVVFGYIAKAAAQYVTGDPTYTVTIGGIAAAVVLLVVNDNTQAAADASILAVDVVKAAATHSLTVAIPQLLKDGLQFIKDVTPKPNPSEAPGTTLGSIAATLMAMVLCASLLTACAMTPPQVSTLQTAIANDEQIGCIVDGVAQPIGASVLAGLVPVSSGAVSLDDLLVHPAILNFCKSLGGTTTKVPAVPAAPTVPATAILPATPAASN